ncbi:2-dehydropantoate 2-reductase [Aquimarina addita]|uniref:2-dehydropantoate 2-reductase n=1 Tax=Aquimarina addita TaxID=870485 RepID=A0ABP7XHS0_9FLAO
MHIVIIGVGGVGGYFGGKMADSGQKVTLVARGKHLNAIQNHGLKVKSISGNFITHPFLATDDIRKVDKADLVLICTKSWQVKEVATLIRPILKEHSVVIPLQNGANNAEKICSVLDKKHVLGGLCKIYSKIEAPGIISHFGHPPEVIFGALDMHCSQDVVERIKKVKEIFDEAGFKGTISKNITVDIWNKFMFIAVVSGLGGLTRATIGEMCKNEELYTMMEQSAHEIYKIGMARVVALEEDTVAKVMQFIRNQPYVSTASTQRDLMEGQPSELDNFNGFIVREGKRLNVPTPVHAFIYACLQPMEAKARKK